MPKACNLDKSHEPAILATHFAALKPLTKIGEGLNKDVSFEKKLPKAEVSFCFEK